MDLGNLPAGRTLLAAASRMLKQLADWRPLAVLVTNHVVSAGVERSMSAPGARDGGTKPALGDQWRGQPNCSVLLAKGNPCTAKLLYSSQMVCRAA
jgi:hypothetical protein